MRPPDNALSLRRYRHHAATYDRTTFRMEPVRERAIQHLALRPGDTVLDVACGTGKSFRLLQRRIGASGRIIGVDHSPEMLAIARKQVIDAGWSNVALIESSMEQARLPVSVDAVLFNYTHDVLQSPAALAKVFGSVRAGARVVSAGMKLFPWWLAPLDIVVFAKAYGYTTTLSGLARPWRLMQDYLEDFAVQSMYCGIAYVAYGRCVAPR